MSLFPCGATLEVLLGHEDWTECICPGASMLLFNTWEN